MEAVHIKVKLTKAIDEALAKAIDEVLVNRGLLLPHLLREHETEALVASKRMKKRCMEIGNGGKAQCPMTAGATRVVFVPSQMQRLLYQTLCEREPIQFRSAGRLRHPRPCFTATHGRTNFLCPITNK
jgi:hypothetical protein